MTALRLRPLEPPGQTRAVLFDLHSTLVDQGDAREWIELAWQRTGLGATARAALGAERFDRLARWADRIWENVVEVDPRNERDLSREGHRQVFDALIARQGGIDEGLAHALYEVMLETWVPYEDAAPTLAQLKRRGIRTAVVSNVGVDVRPVLQRGGLLPLLDVVVLSFEVGAVKPQPAIFECALRALEVAPANALMVGDSARDDAGAALLGMRTLLLPRTRGTVHGLDAVLRLVG